MQKVTAYMTVYLSIKKLIKEGAYKPGMLLPTERDLEKIYAVSRITVRRAIAMLSDEGYVKVVQGKGTEVRDISTTQQLNTVTSITETLKSALKSCQSILSGGRSMTCFLTIDRL